MTKKQNSLSLEKLKKARQIIKENETKCPFTYKDLLLLLQTEEMLKDDLNARELEL